MQKAKSKGSYTLVQNLPSSETELALRRELLMQIDEQERHW